MKPIIAVIAGNKREFDYFISTCYPEDIFRYISMSYDSNPIIMGQVMKNYKIIPAYLKYESITN